MANVNLGGFSPLQPQNPRVGGAAPTPQPAETSAPAGESFTASTKSDAAELAAFIQHQIRNYTVDNPPREPAKLDSSITGKKLDVLGFDAALLSDFEAQAAGGNAPSYHLLGPSFADEVAYLTGLPDSTPKPLWSGNNPQTLNEF